MRSVEKWTATGRRRSRASAALQWVATRSRTSRSNAHGVPSRAVHAGAGSSRSSSRLFFFVTRPALIDAYSRSTHFSIGSGRSPIGVSIRRGGMRVSTAGQAWRGSLLAAEDGRGKEPLAVVREREGRVDGPHHPHLYDSDPKLDVGLADLYVPKVEDPVREEVLAEFREGVRSDRRLRDEERREAELFERGEELEQLPPRPLHVREPVHHLEAVDREDLIAARGDGLLDDPHQDVNPVLRVFRALQGGPEDPKVEDVQLRVLDEVEAHPAHREAEGIRALLERHVQPFVAEVRVVVHDVEHEGRFHRPRRARDEDDAPLRDAATECAVETLHVRLEKREVRLHS